MILRWHPMIQSIVRLREQGVLGEIHTVEADFVFGELEGSEPDWARTVADGGSLHLYAGCHAYDQLEWLIQDRQSKSLGIGPPLTQVGVRRHRVHDPPLRPWWHRPAPP